MARKRMKAGGPIVQFLFEERTYQIDPEQRKVYSKFVEVETSRASEIFSIWRQQEANA